jgi:hypothetical protein
MATSYWKGTATAVAQISTGSIDTVDGTPANNTFTVTIGGVAISQVGDTDVATTAAALVVLLQASTHPYFAAVTWTNPSAGNITGTADTAGVPFVAALTETGAGTGTVTDFSDDTACTGPNFWDDGDNWSEGSAPGASDVVHVADSSINIMWGLSNAGVTVGSITIHDTYTGLLGLDWKKFATSADGATTDATAQEYRQTHLLINPTRLVIGQGEGVGNPAGSGRLQIDCNTDAPQIEVIKTANVSNENGRAAVRLLTNSGTAKLYVRGATGGVSLAADRPDETSTIGDIGVTPSGEQSTLRLTSGAGVTLTTHTQYGGSVRIRGAVTTINMHGGDLTTEGVFLTTTVTQSAGVWRANHSNGGSACVTTLNLDGGTADAHGSSVARTWTTVNHEGGTLAADPGALTVTTYNEPQDGPYSVSVG